MERQKERYGLFTAIAMIVGVVVGSGIFFKADDILSYTGGSIGLGVLVFCIGAISIVFGSLTLAELSIRTEKSGGVVGYYEEFVNKKVAAGFGWFQTFAYFGCMIPVVCWVTAVYTCSLFDISATLELQIGIAFMYMVLIYSMNLLSARFAGKFQGVSTVVKLIPLLGVAIAGFVLKTTAPEIPAGVEVVKASSDVGFGWFAALIPIAFSYDGWVVATTISNEVKNPKKNMPLAFLIGPLTVLAVYLLYFVGLCRLLGNEYIMTMGNDAVNVAGEFLFGPAGKKIMLVFVIIAVVGVANGMTIGGIRMPQALASKRMIPGSEKIEKIHPKYGISIPSVIISAITSCVWLLLHYVTTKSGILGNGDVSEIAIVFSYMCYAILYIKVFKMTRAGVIKNKFSGYVCSVLAMIGSVLILVGGIITSPIFVPIFICICAIICMAGARYLGRNDDDDSDGEFILNDSELLGE